MFNTIKYFLSLIILIGFLQLGIGAGNMLNEANACINCDDPAGWVCGSSQGECVENHNATECVWGPDGCDDGPANPRPE